MSSLQSPFNLPFQDALSSERMLASITRTSEDTIRSDLAQGLSGAAATTLAAGKFIYERKKLLVELPKGAKVSDLMVANGKRVAQLKKVGGNGAGTRLQVVGGGAKVGVNTAAVALVVIEAAHMISSHDNAKRIKTIEKRTADLVAFNEHELLSELEACYRQAKEICLHSESGLSDHDRAELSNLSRLLFKIRAQWRHRVRSDLEKIEKATASWWTSIFQWKREESLEKSKSEKGQKALAVQEILQLMQFSLMLQFALSQQTGRASSFLKNSLKDEVSQWRGLAAFTRKRGKDIFGDEFPENYQKLIEGIDNIAGYWGSLYPPESHEVTPAEYAQQINRSVPIARKQLNAAFAQGRCEKIRRGRSFVYIFETRQP